MQPLKSILMMLMVSALTAAGSAAVAAEGQEATDRSQYACYQQACYQNPNVKQAQNTAQGGKQSFENQKAKTNQNLGADLAKGGLAKLSPIIDSSTIKPELAEGVEQMMVDKMTKTFNQAQAMDSPTVATDAMASAEQINTFVGQISDPQRWTKPAQAAAQAQATNAGNAGAEVSRDQASSAIDFCAHYLANFTVDGGNKWNVLRNNIFVPMGILLLLPGALLTQMRAIMAAGNPILGNINPFEGIQRSVIAIFLIPGTYLVVNYSIDLSNSITFTINSEYFRLFGSDMYKDAICAEIRAFPVRGEQENRNALDLPVPAMTPLVNPGGLFAQFEGMMENKIEDPCSGIFQSPAGRADEAMSSSTIAARLGLNSSNAALTASWNILCAFQMAYLYYLWFVGPVVAGLWVWPMKQLRGALPSWVEGVITLAFWSLFWNTAILLIACFKGVGETGCVLMTALHFLATASVKHAFDFAGLVRAAGQEAANMAEKAMKSGGAGGGSGGGGGGGSCGAKGGGAQGGQAPATADGIGALSSSSTGSGAGNISVAASSPVGSAGDSRSFGSGSGPVDKAGLNEALAMRSAGMSDRGSGTQGSPFDGKPTTDKSLEKLAESGMVPPSEKKFDGDVFSQQSQYAAMFCSAQIADPGVDAPAAEATADLAAELEADAAAESTVAAELAMLKSSESFNAAAMADDTTPPPSETAADLLAQEDAEAAKVAQEQSKKDGTEMVLAQARDKQAEAREANRSEMESKRAERLAESISNHMNNLSVAAASAAAGHHVGEAVAAAAAHSVHALGGHYVADGAAGVAGSSGSNGLNGGGLYAAGSSASFMRDNLADFDVNNALTDISIDSSSSLASTSVSNGWVSSDSLTNADLSRLEFSDIDNMDVLPPANSVASVDASSVVNNAMNANIDSSLVSNPALAVPAVGNVTQYGDVTTYGGVVPSDMIDRSDRSLMSANSYNTANAYTATDSYGAPLVTNSSPMPAVSGTQIDANSVVSNAVYSAQAISGNVVAAVENYNTIPTGAHASLGGQSASSEYYAAQAASGNVVGSVQPNAYAADYSVQSTSNSSNSYAVDYSNQSNAVASNSYAVDYSNQSNAVASNSYAVDYSNQSSAGASNSYAVDYSNQSNAVASNSYAVDYSNQSNSSASHSYAIDNSSQSSTSSPQGTPVFASVLPSSSPADYSAPAQSMTGGLQPANSNEYYSAQATPAPSMVSSSSAYAADYSSTNSASTQYASTANSSSAQYADYSSTSSAQAQYVADYSSTPAQYATAPQASGGTEYASTTQYAPVQGQPSSFIQPSAPANEYYAAPSQSAPLVAALITPSQPISIDAGSVQSYSSPAQYYLAHANTHAENRSVESIAPVDRGPAQQSDVVYSRSGSEAYTTVAPYQHVENAESRPVSFAPSPSHNIQHGPQNVAQSESQSEAYLSQQQVHSKVQAAQGLITRMNTILAGFDAPHVVPAGTAAAAKSNVSNQVAAAKPEAPAMSAQPVAQQAPAKKSLHDLLPVQRKAKTPPKEEMVVTPPPMSNSWFDA